MITKEEYTYIKEMKDLSYDFDQIRVLLRDNGWDDPSISHAFAEYNRIEKKEQRAMRLDGVKERKKERDTAGSGPNTVRIMNGKIPVPLSVKNKAGMEQQKSGVPEKTGAKKEGVLNPKKPAPSGKKNISRYLLKVLILIIIGGLIGLIFGYYYLWDINQPLDTVYQIVPDLLYMQR